jgi:2-oxoglutarate ferredoxin oxidoreductase subunit alpha
MTKDVFTFIVGGKAGEGVKKAGNAAANLLASRGLRVFQMDDYQSLIKGGHNFSVVSAAARDIMSHYMAADLVVNLDARSLEIHKGHLAEGGLSVRNSDAVNDGPGVGIPITSEARKLPDPMLRVGLSSYVALCAVLGMDEAQTAKAVEGEYKRDVENNLAYAKAIHGHAWPALGGKLNVPMGGERLPMLYGNEAIALGAAAGGLDIYVAYPMTPASSILHYLAAHAEDLKVVAVHPENEIAVANIAIGAAVVGARAMVGSSGGGFALMEEALSLAGMTETPLLCVLSSRPGPSTGVPTYTMQGDLAFALGQGHGEYPRIVASPGSPQEAFYLSAELLSLAWRFQTPAILLTEKHLAESRASVSIDVDKAAWPSPEMHASGAHSRYMDTPSGISPLLFPPTKEMIKWNSYEHDERGITTDVPEAIAKMHDKRSRKGESLVQHLRDSRTVNVFGEGEKTIVTYGSTTMSVLEALRCGGIAARVVQPVYLQPFPFWEFERLGVSGPVVVEQSPAGAFAQMLSEKVGINVEAVIVKYDGRPFEPTELAAQLGGVL